MAQDSVSFLPPTLAGLLRLYAEDLQRGVSDADGFVRTLWSKGQHTLPQIAGTLDTEMHGIAQLIREHRPFASIFYRFGRLIGPVAELNEPLHMGAPEDPVLPRVREGFGTLSEAAGPQFRILWKGYRDELMDSLSPRQYILESSQRAAELYPILYDAFIVNGQVLPASSFDYRSIPFGVAAISYSRSVNDIVNVWCAVWRTAGGDMSGRPYR